ncbi:MAG TPA: PAS domain S-box protein, partial [Dehalococcoidia bacterium]|nr:PAS domain S-box protein [Dehalococcoidia bacterium]
MSATSIAAQWVLGGAYVLLGMATSVDWLRHRDPTRRYLTVSVALLGVVALFSGIKSIGFDPAGWLTDFTLVAFVASGWAFLRFRAAIIPVAPRGLLAADAGVAAAIIFMLAAFAPAGGMPATGPLQTVAAFVLLAAWAGCVGEPLGRFWRLSQGLPSVQRSRLRALVAAYGCVVLVLALSVAVAVVHTRGAGAVATIVISLLTVPLFYVAFAPPRWLRRFWREREEEPFRQALTRLLLFSPDRQTLAERAVGWAARLVGADSALIATDDGAVLATHNLDDAHTAELLPKVAAMESPPPPGIIRLRLSSEYVSGWLAIRTGPLTPLFSSDEEQRLRSYVTAVTTAMDRVLLVERLRRSAELIDLAYNPIFTYNAKTGLLTYWNKAAEHTYGYTAAEAIGRSPDELLRSRLPKPREAIVAELRARRRWNGDVVQVTKSGRILHVNSRWALQTGSAGDDDTILEVNRDITQQQRM